MTVIDVFEDKVLCVYLVRLCVCCKQWPPVNKYVSQSQKAMTNAASWYLITVPCSLYMLMELRVTQAVALYMHYHFGNQGKL